MSHAYIDEDNEIPYLDIDFQMDYTTMKLMKHDAGIWNKTASERNSL